jgi:hypothetical protein
MCGGGCMVAHGRTDTACQDSGHLQPKRRRNGMADQIDTAVDRMETRLAQSMVDRGSTHSGGEQLGSTDDAMLRRCNRRYRSIAGLGYVQIAHSCPRRAGGADLAR